MKTTGTDEWLLLSWLTLTGVLVFGVFYFLAVRFITPADDVRDYYAGVVGFVEHSATNSVEGSGADHAGRIGSTLVLKTGAAVELGESILVYRGLTAAGGFEVNVVIPAFDPQSSFPYTFTAAEARKGFKLANRAFRLLSATPTFLHLEEVRE